MRRFETRQLLSDGWTTEWEPAPEFPPLRDDDAKRFVREFNARSKAEGSAIRMRSVEVEDAFT